EEPGRRWAAGRFDAPYLRDSMLDAGVLVETLETAAYWSHLRRTYDAVSAALTEALGKPALVLCHVSHVYETGASLYFTVAAPEGDDALGRWRDAKRAAMEAIVDTGATITHHHAVATAQVGGRRTPARLTAGVSGTQPRLDEPGRTVGRALAMGDPGARAGDRELAGRLDDAPAVVLVRKGTRDDPGDEHDVRVA